MKTAPQRSLILAAAALALSSLASEVNVPPAPPAMAPTRPDSAETAAQRNGFPRSESGDLPAACAPLASWGEMFRAAAR